MTEIKHKAGDVVYWLSNRGFTKGYIKRIYFEQQINPETKNVSTTLQYFLKEEKDMGVYMGDNVPENLVFHSYKEMLEHYQKQKV